MEEAVKGSKMLGHTHCPNTCKTRIMLERSLGQRAIVWAICRYSGLRETKIDGQAVCLEISEKKSCFQ